MEAKGILLDIIGSFGLYPGDMEKADEIIERFGLDDEDLDAIDWRMDFAYALEKDVYPLCNVVIGNLLSAVASKAERELGLEYDRFDTYLNSTDSHLYYKNSYEEETEEVYEWKDLAEISTKEKYSKIILEDDETDTGGTEIEGERLYDFMNSVSLEWDASEEEINKALAECGIKPVELE